MQPAWGFCHVRLQVQGADQVVRLCQSGPAAPTIPGVGGSVRVADERFFSPTGSARPACVGALSAARRNRGSRPSNLRRGMRSTSSCASWNTGSSIADKLRIGTMFGCELPNNNWSVTGDLPEGPSRPTTILSPCDSRPSRRDSLDGKIVRILLGTASDFFRLMVESPRTRHFSATGASLRHQERSDAEARHRTLALLDGIGLSVGECRMRERAIRALSVRRPVTRPRENRHGRREVQRIAQPREDDRRPRAGGDPAMLAEDGSPAGRCRAGAGAMPLGRAGALEHRRHRDVDRCRMPAQPQAPPAAEFSQMTTRLPWLRAAVEALCVLAGTERLPR